MFHIKLQHSMTYRYMHKAFSHEDINITIHNHIIYILLFIIIAKLQSSRCGWKLIAKHKNIVCGGVCVLFVQIIQYNFRIPIWMKCLWFGFAYHESSVFTTALTPHPLSQQFGQTQCLYIDVHTHVLLYQTLPIFSFFLSR